jgi:hypothetical protein
MGTANRRPLVPLYRSLFLLAGGLAFAGQRFSLPLLINLALLCLGVMTATMGVELIVTKRAESAIGGFAYIQAVEVFTGLAAQLWGVMFLLLGLVIIVGIVAQWLAPAAVHAWYGSLVGTKAGLGLALCASGLFAGLWGTMRLLAGSAGLDLGWMTRLSNIVDRIGGGIALLAGLGLLGVGVLLVVAPAIVTSAWVELWRSILQR